MNLISKKFNELSTTEIYEILKARSEIFILEQNIHYQDMDGVDYNSLHCFFMESFMGLKKLYLIIDYNSFY